MKAIKQLAKMVGAAIVAVIILSLIVSIYSTNPMRVENLQGNTDYVWKSNSLWANMSEGVSFGKMDANGFNNIEIVKSPDVLLLGSSHIESKNVNQDQNTAYYLEQNFDNRYSVYNMGISGHTIYKVCQYLPKSLSVYQDNMPRYVVIETDNIDLTKEGVSAAINQTLEKTPVYNAGLMVMLQQIPAFRLFYHQLDSGLIDLLLPELKKGSTGQSDIVANNDSPSTLAEADIQHEDNFQYDELMSYLSNIQDQCHTSIIIFFHPFEKLNEDGTISFINDSTTDLFASSAEKYGITYIDMTKSFEKMYNEENHVPHGFITGEIASGHLNKFGHKAIADSIYDTITEMEG